jgi:hypothetical protein
MRLEGADLVATLAQKLASGNRGDEAARMSTAAYSADVQGRRTKGLLDAASLVPGQEYSSAGVTIRLC